jgi:hypothetical protein
MMNNLEVGFFAGVIDSRMHLQASPNLVRARVTCRRHDLLDWLSKHTGVTTHLDGREYQRRACGEHCSEKHVHQHRQSAYWNVDGLRAGIVLWDCLPYLVYSRNMAQNALRILSSRWPRNPEREPIFREMDRMGWNIPSFDELPKPNVYREMEIR